MHRLLLVLFSLSFVLSSCSDGDVLVFDLTFDEVLELCNDENIGIDNYTDINESYVVYDINTDPNESLILLFPGDDAHDLIFYPQETSYEKTLIINGSSVRFNFRTYNGDPNLVVCAEIPSENVNIKENFEASEGEIQTISTYEDENNVRTVTVSFTVVDFNLDILNSTSDFIGTYTHSYPVPD